MGKIFKFGFWAIWNVVDDALSKNSAQNRIFDKNTDSFDKTLPKAVTKCDNSCKKWSWNGLGNEKVTILTWYIQKIKDNDDFLTLGATLFGLFFLYAQKRAIIPVQRTEKCRILRCKNWAFVQSRCVKQTVCRFDTALTQNPRNHWKFKICS